YAAVNELLGFAAAAGEHEIVGLASLGEPTYVDAIRGELVDLKEDGSVELNAALFSFLSQPTLVSEKLASLLGGPPRQLGAPIGQREVDLARSASAVGEEAVLRAARFAKKLTGERKLAMAGALAHRAAADGRLLREGLFDDIWIQPAGGDAGGAIGAALD